MKSYVLRVVLEPDEDTWRAYVPELEVRGAATWGKTREEALRNIQEVTHQWPASFTRCSGSQNKDRLTHSLFT